METYPLIRVGFLLLGMPKTVTKHIILPLCLICIALLVKAQDTVFNKSQQSQVSLTGFTGNIIAHCDTLRPLTHGRVYGVRFTLTQKVDGSRAWHRLHKMPNIGLSLIYIDLGDNKVQGSAWGLQPIIAYPIINCQNFLVKPEMGLGLAYVTQKYSPLTNPTNVAISTSMNYWASVNLISTYRLTEHCNVTAGIETNHFSNGAIKKPNYGLNIIGISLGFTYRIDGMAYGKQFQIARSETKPHLLLYVGAGIKETGPSGGMKYYPISLSVDYHIPMTELISYISGIDIMYDTSSHYHIELTGKHYSPVNDDFQVGLKVGIVLPFNRLSLFGQLGAYLYNPNPRLPALYQKLGLRYMVAPRFQLQMELKTHLNTADHVEMGIAIAM